MKKCMEELMKKLVKELAKKPKTWKMAVAALAICAVAAVGLAGCVSNNPVAATINGKTILESTITHRIMFQRDAQSSYADDAYWATVLDNSKLNPQSFREQVIESEVTRIIIKELAAARNLLNDATIDAMIAQMKLTIGGSETTWLNALKARGYMNEADYRNLLEERVLKNELLKVLEPVPTQEELEEYILPISINYVGKRSSAIVLQPTGNQTQEDIDAIVATIMEALADGASFTELVAKHSTNPITAAVDGDMGWSSLVSLDTAYRQALSGLAVGEISEAFTTAGGVTYIIMCTDEFAADGDDFDTVPSDIVEFLTAQWVAANKSVLLQKLIDEAIEASDLIVNPMPRGLPYDVDMKLSKAFSSSGPQAIADAIEEGLIIEDIEEGDGIAAESRATLEVYYTGTLEDGTVFDSTDISGETYSFILGYVDSNGASVIAGWNAGLVGMKEGGTRTLVIPPSLGYGSTDHGSIPADSTLYFEVTLVKVTLADWW